MQEQKPNGEMENMNQLQSLFQLTMQKKWELVIEFYKTHSWAHKAKLTKSEETALHVAVSSCHAGRTGTKPSYIKSMIEFIHKDEEYNVLSMQNNKGNTPLHLAATVGSVAICEYISMKHPDLIKIRNSKGETPVFRAAKHGNTEAFLCFRQFYHEKKEERQEEIPVERPEEITVERPEEITVERPEEKQEERPEEKQEERPEEFESLCRRHDGNTVLHTAISGAYFRLAYQIICYYPTLVNSVNVDGESPLHVLAKKPNMFKSSSYLGFYDSIIYYCLIVDGLEQQKYNQGADQNVLSPTSEINFPENYRTCVNIFHFLLDPIHKSIKASLGSDEENQQIIGTESQKEERNDDGFFPPNYATCILLVKFGFKVILTVLGIGFWRIQKIQEKKQRWTHSLQVMNEMIKSSEGYKYDIDGQKPAPKLEPLYPGRIDQLPSTPPTADDIDPHLSTETNTGTTPSREVQKHTEKEKDQSHSVKNGNETPILVAAKMGITEMVKKILDKWPIAIQDLDSNEKNVLLLAAENRQISVFDYLVQLNLPEYMFHQVDNKGNSILHLAAVFGKSHPWRIPGAALQMQWEIKWYKHVKNSIPKQYLPHHNVQGETPKQIFTETHRTLVKDGTGWLIKTSESCSLIAALIATVAFATAATVPGGLDQQLGSPILRGHRAFDVFSISSLLALCLSVTALVYFLGIITSRCQERDFKMNLPRKLLMGLTCLFASISAILVSFCAGHTFILRDHLKIAALSIYATTSVPVTLFALGHLNLYFDLLQAVYRKVPLRSYKVFNKSVNSLGVWNVHLSCISHNRDERWEVSGSASDRSLA